MVKGLGVAHAELGDLDQILGFIRIILCQGLEKCFQPRHSLPASTERFEDDISFWAWVFG